LGCNETAQQENDLWREIVLLKKQIVEHDNLNTINREILWYKPGVFGLLPKKLDQNVGASSCIEIFLRK
jgi:hypothetical protein